MIVLVLLIFVFGLAYWLFLSPYSQVFGYFPYRNLNEKKKIIALTFDDGPNEPYTSEILDFLDSENIKATFFQVAKAVVASPEISKRIVKTGHVIGNHFYLIVLANTFSQPSFKAEIDASQEIFNSVTGKRPALFRPPWLFRTPVLFRTLKSFGMTPISGVFCHSLEVFQIKSQSISKSAIKKAKPGGILIFHDGFDGKGAVRDQTVEALKLTVKALKVDGYKFVTVSDLLNIKSYL